MFRRMITFQYYSKVLIKRNISEVYGAIQQTTNKTKVNETNLYHDDQLNISYTRLKRNDPFLSKIMLPDGTDRRLKLKQKHFIVEGRRLIIDGLKSGLKLKRLVFSQYDQLKKIIEYLSLCGMASVDTMDFDVYEIFQHDLKFWSNLTTCPGILGIFNHDPSNLNRIQDATKKLPVTVICDNIREPNNLGGIIRTCAALPCQEVIVTKGCANPWDRKCLRGGAGGHFRIKISERMDWDDVAKHLVRPYQLFIAENSVENMRKYGAQGPLINYEKINYVTNDVKETSLVLIIGGEVHGISSHAHHLYSANKMNGGFVNVPLYNGVDSLNTSVALSVVLFEMRRQLLSANFNLQK